jgi:hypothetical protein
MNDILIDSHIPYTLSFAYLTRSRYWRRQLIPLTLLMYSPGPHLGISSPASRTT